MNTLGPIQKIIHENKVADIYDRNTHYTIELYKDSVWQAVRTAKTKEEAVQLSNEYVTN